MGADVDVLGLDTATRCVILVGDYGSGKTEIAVNLAATCAMARTGVARSGVCAGPGDDGLGRADIGSSDEFSGGSSDGSPVGAAVNSGIVIADLDLVNPYFRCREAMEPLEQLGIRVIVPQGGHRFADLPILLPQVKGLLQTSVEHDGCPGGIAILDVGGDEVGSRVLAGLSSVFRPDAHELWFVVNTNRPFNDTPEGCIATVRRIEGASGIRVSGLVPNSHLMQETTVETVMHGVEMAEKVAARIDVPVRLVSVMNSLADSVTVSYPVLRMRRLMVPPWLRREMMETVTTTLGRTGPDLFKQRLV